MIQWSACPRALFPIAATGNQKCSSSCRGEGDKGDGVNK